MLALLVANLKMMVRDRQALFWALVFPLIFVVVFGLFDVGGSGSADIVIIDHADTSLSRGLREALSEIEFLNINDEYASQAEAQEALEDGDLEYLLVIPETLTKLGAGTEPAEPVTLILYYDQANIQENQLVEGVLRQFLDDVNLELAQVDRLLDVAPQPVQARDVEYFDVLLIGLVGMGVMFNSVMVIAVKISGYRQQRILKRIKVTPLPVRSYFISEVLTHLLLSMVQAAIILAVGVFVFGASIHGNIGWLFLIVAFTNIIFLNIGFTIAGRTSGPAAASGLGNAIVVPMMFFSGTFFPTSSLPSFLPELVKVLPLTQMLDAMRQVTIHAEPIWQAWPELAILGGWMAASSLLAVRLFRFT